MILTLTDKPRVIIKMSNKKISQMKGLIDTQKVNQIIWESNIGTYTDVDIEKFTKERIDIYLEKCLELLYQKPKLFEQFYKESNEYSETRYHKENLITHLYCVGWICVMFCEKFNLEPEYAFQLGFFHDIGKPWAKKYIQLKSKLITNTKGHAQVGENICYELGLDKKITWCVSNHMCSCCHGNTNSTHWEYVSSIQTISLDSDLTNEERIEYSNSLACLMIGDDLGRSGESDPDIPNTITHSFSWLDYQNKLISNPDLISNSVKYLSTLHPDDSIIVQMYGLSGFGKSYTCKDLIEFLDHHKITWDYAERDQSYYIVYSNEMNIPLESAYQSSYTDVYSYIEKNSIKSKVQQNWIDRLNEVLDSNSKVKIIDSVQMLYSSSWESTLSSLNPDAYSVWESSIKFGYYGFPQSLYDRKYKPKTHKYELIPRDSSDHLTWPNMNSELDLTLTFNPELIDVAYGNIDFIKNSIRNYIKWATLKIPEQQIHLIQMIDQIPKFELSSDYIQSYIKKQFPPGIIITNEELSHCELSLVRFGYRDGMQIFNGPSRDYRGDTILFNQNTLEYYIGRVSLPVFPDYSDLRKDPLTKQLIETSNTFHIVPKFDGSMFVLTLVKIDSPQYPIIQKMVKYVDPSAWYSNHLGIWCLGSKGCMFAKNQFGHTGILLRINNAINGSYQSIDNFIHLVSMEIEKNNYSNIYDSLSMVFEAIDVNPTDELTVDYGIAFCPFLCWIGWNNMNMEKKIILPNDITWIKPSAQIVTVDTWEQVIQYHQQTHQRLLEGSEDEPEGFVVWIGDTNIGVKLKHFEYYAAHKPYSKKNIEMANIIEFDQTYSKLKQRLIKFKPKPPIESLIKEDVEHIHKLFNDPIHFMETKKSWVIFWKQQYNVSQLNDILSSIESTLIQYYPQFRDIFRDKGFQYAMYYYDRKNNNNENNNEHNNDDKYLFELFLKFFKR